MVVKESMKESIFISMLWHSALVKLQVPMTNLSYGVCDRACFHLHVVVHF